MKNTNIVIRPDSAQLAVITHSPSIGIRSYLSGGMLRSAICFANIAQSIEDVHPGEWRSPYIEEHRDYVLSSIINSALFLEAAVNELFSDAAQEHGIQNNGFISPLTEETRALMKSWWEESGDMHKTLVKYQMLMSFANQSKFDKSKDPYQSAALLVELRNRIVHYKPETIYGEEPHKLENKLKGRFEENALIPFKSSNWWPDRALGAGCAKWSHESAKMFADELSSRLGIEPNYKRISL